MQGIIVGVDNSVGASLALEWAAKAAQAFEATLHVVNVIDISQVWMQHAYDEVSSNQDIERIRNDAAETRKRALADTERMVEALALGDGVNVEIHVVDDHKPARKLTELAKDADMLVVGSRGLGGVSGMLLGSVSQQCAARAQCPVVIVHGPK